MSIDDSASERKAYKDYFDRAAARALAGQVAAAMPAFDQYKFVRLATRDLSSHEFAARVKQFSEALAATLPSAVSEALGVLTRSLPTPLPDCESVTDGWLQWPVGQFIADYGLAHFDAAMEAMIELTQRFSSEYAVRPFVEHRPEATFERLLELTDHSSPHVRRWCSEGVRPRLPWGKKLRALVQDPKPIWPIIEALKDDDELYVRRSVANNLNDIAKDHAQQVIRRCRTWSKSSNARRDWTVNHALRSLIKAGDSDALSLIGFAPPHRLKASLSIRPKRIEIGGEVEMLLQLDTDAAVAQDLLVDYAVHYVRKGDKTTAKVFKWATVRLPAMGSIAVNKRHPMRPTTVRSLYPGVHRVALQVNGVRVADSSFRLTTGGQV